MTVGVIQGSQSSRADKTRSMNCEKLDTMTKAKDGDTVQVHYTGEIHITINGTCTTKAATVNCKDT